MYPLPPPSYRKIWDYKDVSGEKALNNNNTNEKTRILTGTLTFIPHKIQNV